MKRFILLSLLALGAGVAVVAAQQQEDKDALIALDQKWGEAGMKNDTATAEALLADDLMSVEPTGILNKAGVIASNQPDPDPNARYQPANFQIMFLGPDTAVMSHTTPDHNSLHVWAKRGGEWKVVASATVPREESGQ
jgi:Domain of unknown function (DUF4440)